MNVKSALSSNIDAAGMRAKYDECAKILLSNKYILAHIMKECVAEFRDVPIDTIRKECILSDPRIPAALHRDEGPGATDDPDRDTGADRWRDTGTGDQLLQTGVEDVTMTEGLRTFDIRFDAIVSGGMEPVCLIINIEAQKKPDPGYRILKRAVYYCGRLISGQYNTVFQNSDYDKIRKVYSIWVCTNAPAELRNTITEYSLTERQVIGNGHEDPDSYDLITIIKLNLSSGESVEHRGILRLLTVLLSHRMTPAEKKKVLSEEFDIPMTHEIDTEVDSMCNLSEGIWVEAKNEGRIEGIAEGRAEGREEGDYNHARNSALRMAKDNLPLDMIAKYVSYSTDVVRSWIAAAAAE